MSSIDQELRLALSTGKVQVGSKVAVQGAAQRKSKAGDSQQ